MRHELPKVGHPMSSKTPVQTRTRNPWIDKLSYHHQQMGNDMQTVTLSPKFQVVIPKSVRKALRLKPGHKMHVMEYVSSPACLKSST